MIRNNIISYYIILLLFPALSVAGNIEPILRSIKPNSITIIGESHQRPESIKLFQSLIKGYLKNNKCLTIALEIDSNQQGIIDNVVQRRASVFEIKIFSTIDHPPLRKMINDLANQKNNGACLSLVAIDAGDEINMGRDEWMSIKLSGQVGNTPVLALLGSLHALRSVQWDLSMTKGKPFVAEILNKKGVSVSSFIQDWKSEVCKGNNSLQNYFISSESVKATALLNQSIFSLLNAFEIDSVLGVVDGVIIWECGT